MITLLIFVIFGAMVGLILYELVDQVQGSAHRLQDRYHD